MAATELGFKSASEYTKTIERKHFDQQKFIKYNVAFSSGTKYLASHLAHKISYKRNNYVEVLHLRITCELIKP